MRPFSLTVDWQESTPCRAGSRKVLLFVVLIVFCSCCGSSTRSEVLLFVDFTVVAAVTDSENVAASNASIKCFTLEPL